MEFFFPFYAITENKVSSSHITTLDLHIVMIITRDFILPLRGEVFFCFSDLRSNVIHLATIFT
jgi:hypothetical protein